MTPRLLRWVEVTDEMLKSIKLLTLKRTDLMQTRRTTYFLVLSWRELEENQDLSSDRAVAREVGGMVELTWLISRVSSA